MLKNILFSFWVQIFIGVLHAIEIKDFAVRFRMANLYTDSTSIRLEMNIYLLNAICNGNVQPDPSETRRREFPKKGRFLQDFPIDGPTFEFFRTPNISIWKHLQWLGVYFQPRTAFYPLRLNGRI